MNLQELRIGNWIKLEDKGFYQIDTGHDIDELDSFPEGDTYLEPIPLTEDILLKCGFDVEDDNPKQKIHYEGDILFKIKIEKYIEFEFSNSMVDGFICYQLGLTIKYLHQLQNLFYCLKGEELTVNL